MAPAGFCRDARYKAVTLDRRQLLATKAQKESTSFARRLIRRAVPALPEDADPFERPYWNRLQVEMWVYCRAREAVRLAVHKPGSSALYDLQLGPDGWEETPPNDEQAPLGEGEYPVFANEHELICMITDRYGRVLSIEDTNKAITVAISKNQLRIHTDPSMGDEFFEREEVLALWCDQPAGNCASPSRRESVSGRGSAVATSLGAAEAGNDARYRTGAPGRPGSMHLIWHEYERRKHAGLLEPSLAAEARYLAEWLKRAHREAAPNKPRSIENRIRDDYRKYRQTHKIE
jgi:hypothetical protein